MKANPSKHWKRLQGRWVIAAYRPWTNELVYYTQSKIPAADLLMATSWPTQAQAKNALRYLKLRTTGKLRWWPKEVKDTELFLEVLKDGR